MKHLANMEFSKTLTMFEKKSRTKNLANADLGNAYIFKILIESDENQNQKHYSYHCTYQ